LSVSETHRRRRIAEQVRWVSRGSTHPTGYGLLHAFIKKTRKAPSTDIQLAAKRMKEIA
jgi:hypothetical protein